MLTTVFCEKKPNVEASADARVDLGHEHRPIIRAPPEGTLVRLDEGGEDSLGRRIDCADDGELGLACLPCRVASYATGMANKYKPLNINKKRGSSGK